jgi:hypothetical protein
MPEDDETVGGHPPGGDETAGVSPDAEATVAGPGAWPDADSTVAATSPPPPGSPTDDGDGDEDGRRRWLLFLAGALVVGLAVGIGAALLSGGDDNQVSSRTTTTRATTTTSSSTTTSSTTTVPVSSTTTTTAPTTTTTTTAPAPKPAFTSASASPGTVQCVAGVLHSVTISWATTNATSVAVAGVPGSRPPSGSVSVDGCASTSKVVVARGTGGSTSTTVSWTHTP